MGNEATKARRSSHDIMAIANREPLYQKKTRPLAAGRFEKREEERRNSKDGAASISSRAESPLLKVKQPGADRRRSRSLSQTQLIADAQAITMKSKERKSSEGLVPSLNRLRIQQCFKGAKPQIGEWIMKRAAASRPDLRAFHAGLNEQQLEQLQTEMYSLIADAVSNTDNPEKVLGHAKSVGEQYADLCPLGFRPDYFAPLADAAIAECVKLDGGTHKRCETLLAWSQLFAALFSSVRDGYYQRVRVQRRSSLPQHVFERQLSQFSKSIDIN